MKGSVARLEPALVASFPSHMESGVLYISLQYRTCAHLCACGCGEEVVTPLAPAQWRITYDGKDVSLAPSVGNWALDCQSHYWIDRGQVRWSRRFTHAEIQAGREADRRAVRSEIANVSPTSRPRWLQSLLRKGSS